MTNPSNAVGTNAGYNGRTSVKAFNDVLASMTKGVLSGWACEPSSGMTVTIGGSGDERDVAVAEDNAGNRTTINNRSGAPISITIGDAPTTNSRIDAIVAYVESNFQGVGASDVDFPSGVGLITVSGTTAANPVVPTDTQIRDAITADGATGTSAYYVVLATILVGTNVTTIGSGVITQGGRSAVASSVISQFNSTDTITTIPNVTIDGKSLTLAQSDDGSTFKFYGNLFVSNSSSSSKQMTPVAVTGVSGYYGIDTGMVLNNTTSGFVVGHAGTNAIIKNNAVMNMSDQAFAVGSNGHIYICITTSSGGAWIEGNGSRRFFYAPCLYFNKNFGDA